MKVNEALADALATEAQGPIFGLMGDANMPIWDILGRDSRTRMVSARYDGAAVLMADGYARATGKLGVATVTCGPGLASCANALVTASRAGTGLVLFTGEYSIADGGLGVVQNFDQRRFAAACEAGFQYLGRLDTLAEDIAEGFFMARTQARPVILSMPASLWEADLPWEWRYRASTEYLPTQIAVPSRADLQKIVDLMAQAQRPVIVAGRGALLADAEPEITRLADQIGALLATSLLAKGLFDGHPYDIGISGSFSSRPTETLMAQADLVLGIGASLNFFTCEGGVLFPRADIVRIDTRAYPAAIGVAPGDYLRGDARATSLALLALLQELGIRKEGYRTSETREILDAPTPQPPPATDGLDPRALMRALARELPEGTRVVSGGGHFWSWPVAHLALPPGGRYQHAVDFGSIGLALAHGIGAAVGNVDAPTVVIEGDGSLLQGIQELHAAAEQGIQVIVVIMNDSGYGAEVRKMQWKNRDPRDAQWHSPDFVSIARGFGGDGLVVMEEDEVGPAIRKALESRGPFVIDARISPTLVSDSEARLYLGQENSAPLLRPVQVR